MALLKKFGAKFRARAILFDDGLGQNITLILISVDALRTNALQIFQQGFLGMLES